MPHGLLSENRQISADDNQCSTQLPLTRLSLLQRLKILHGVGGRLPLGLPPQLEALVYTAEPAAGSETPFTFEHLTAAAETILCLPQLKQLTVQHCLGQDLPLALIRRLPHSIKVGSSCFGSVHMFAEQYMCMAATALIPDALHTSGMHCALLFQHCALLAWCQQRYPL